jgi:hypothetical protein
MSESAFLRRKVARIIAVLRKEIDAIHHANPLYWKQNTAVTDAAQKAYQRRQDRLEEIRQALFIITLRQAALSR